MRYPEYQRTNSTIVADAPIVVAGPVHSLTRFPHGFERVDIFILDWIVAAGATRGPLLCRGALN